MGLIVKPAPSEEIEKGQALAKLARLDFVDLGRMTPDPAPPEVRAAVLPEQFARRNHVAPVGWNRGTPVIAIATPENVLTLDDIRAAIGREIKVVIACKSQIDEYLDHLYGPSSANGTSSNGSPSNGTSSNGSSSQHHAVSNGASRLPPAGASDAVEPTGEAPRPGEVSEAARATYLSRIHGTMPYVPEEPTAERPPSGDLTLVDASPVEASVVDDARVDAVPPEPPFEALEPVVQVVEDLGVAEPEAPTTPIAIPSVDVEPVAEDVAIEIVSDAESPESGGATILPLTTLRAGAPAGSTETDGGLTARPTKAAKDWFSDALRTPADELRLDDLEIPEPVEERPIVSIEQLLLEWGKATPEDIAIAQKERTDTGRSMRDIIAELRIVSDDDLLHAVAVEAGFEFVDLNEWTIDERAADLIPESISRRYKVIGIGFRGDKPVVGIANPFDVFALDDVRTVVGGDIEAVVCPPRQIDEYLGRLFSQNAEADIFARDAALSASAAESTPGADVTNLLAVVDDAPIVKFVNLILRQALNQRASDIHIEPAVDNLQVRFRIDGVLHHVTSAPKAIQAGVTSRLKIMADLDIAEHRVPQDGRISLRVGSREIDLRVASLPTVHGEKIALRVLDKSSVTLDLEKLGFQPDVLARYEAAYRKPYGTILVTGPTGSGKSTTLYATLSKLNSAERNLITVEDPVEYQLRGINQVQVSPKAGLSFASALRSILRSDPDVVLVGEIRDRDTATTAIEAALTGHLVLTCLHTNDAAGTPMRLIEMGVEPFLVGASLDCVLGQRLARVLCNTCAESYEPNEQDLTAAGITDDDLPQDGPPRFRRAVGCHSCSNTGYHGRMSIQEVMIVTEEIERAIVTRMQSSEIQRLAVEQGMRTMRHDGLRKAALGMTSIEEILRVVI